MADIFLYCDLEASGANDGSSWDDAFNELNTAIAYCEANSISDRYTISLKVNRYVLNVSNITRNIIIDGGFDFEQVKYRATITIGSQVFLTNTLEILNCDIDSSGIGPAVTLNTSGIYRSYNSNIVSRQFIRVNYEYGYVDLSNVEARGDSNSDFCVGNGYSFDLTGESFIDNYRSLIDNKFRYVTVNNSHVFTRKSSIINVSGVIDVYNSKLISKEDKAFSLTESSYLSYVNSTISEQEPSTYSGSGTLYIYSTLYDNAPGIVLPGSISGVFEKSYFSNEISGYITRSEVKEGGVSDSPNFVDMSLNNYDVKMSNELNSDETSALINIDKTTEDGDLIKSELHKYSVKLLGMDDSSRLTYFNNDETLCVFNDMYNEVYYAKHMLPELRISHSETQEVTHRDIVTESSFHNEDNLWPWDWDVKNIYTPIVGRYDNVITPRSIIPLRYWNTGIGEIPSRSNEIKVSTSDIEAKAYKKQQPRGIAFDYGNSNVESRVIWSVDSDNMLTQYDMFTGDFLGVYPLMSKEKNFDVKLSGVIQYNKTDDGYEYLVQDDLDTIITGSDDGRFRFLSMEKDNENSYDIRGLLVYKDIIYLTSTYTKNGVDSEARLLLYDAKSYYDKYVTYYPEYLTLNPDNQDPRGITVYEDGDLIIADSSVSYSRSGIYRAPSWLQGIMSSPYSDDWDGTDGDPWIDPDYPTISGLYSGVYEGTYQDTFGTWSGVYSKTYLGKNLFKYKQCYDYGMLAPDNTSKNEVILRENYNSVNRKRNEVYEVPQ